MSVELTTTETVSCKHCGSTAVQKYGSYTGKDGVSVPRYMCKVCHRKFKWDTKQAHMKTDTEQVATALHDYYDGGSSVRAIGRHILSETGKTPSTATIYEWIQKYTQYIKDSIKSYHPKVGRKWIADETVVTVGGHKLWLWDVIDEKTRYLLASRLSPSRTTKDAQALMNKAIRTAGVKPKEVLTDSLASYLDVNYGKGAEHVLGNPFKLKETGESTSIIERWHGTVKARTKVMRGLKNFESASDFADGYLAYYNYLRPHESLDKKTPASAADIEYPYKNWAELMTYKPSVPIRIEHQKRGSPSIIDSAPLKGRRRARLSLKTPRIQR